MALEAWLDALVLAAVMVAVVWHLRAGMNAAHDSARDDVMGIRRGSLIAALGTFLLVGGCSATGLRNVRGVGYQLALGQPAVYVATLLVLVGPLLVLLVAPALLTLGRMSARRVSLVVIACWLGAAMAALTGYTGFVTSYTVFCGTSPLTAAGDASCAASTGALAAVSGVLGLVAVLPFAIRLRRRT